MDKNTSPKSNQISLRFTSCLEAVLSIAVYIVLLYNVYLIYSSPFSTSGFLTLTLTESLMFHSFFSFNIIIVIAGVIVVTK